MAKIAGFWKFNLSVIRREGFPETATTNTATGIDDGCGWE